MIFLEAKQYFYKLHDVSCNQKYNGTLPYSFHLEMVLSQAQKFSDLVKNRYDKRGELEVWDIIKISCLGHDSIEDARLTYNDIKEKFGVEVAEIVYLCTENKGRTRAERKDAQWYCELKSNELAVFVKLCDIIANVKFSLLTNSSMFKKYKSEYVEKVKPHLYSDQYRDMFAYLDKIFEI
jgi:(p)ppGpp synthase/HD superfamily hydrolase